MEPVEINAGTWYLRALRADERVDDRPALLAMAQDPGTGPALDGVVDLPTAGARVAASARGWATDTGYAWAVCEPSTGEMLAEVALLDVRPAEHRAELACSTTPAHRGRGIATTAVGAVLRLAFADAAIGGLGLHRVEWRHGQEAPASAALAARLGFRPNGSDAGTATDGGDPVVLVRLATDPPPDRI
ncbi:GNAT family N-acetyltransferase [Rhodococcus aerolatus]